MIGDDERNAVILVDSTTKLSDRSFCVEKSLGSEAAECNDDFRLDQLQLPHEIRAARRDFIGKRIPVARRAVLEDVADEYVLALEIDGGKNLGEKLACRSHERPSRRVLVCARRFANAYQLGRWTPLSGNWFGCSLVKPAARALRYGVLYRR